uniref:Uncharacterized protein n=1 Tax=Globodera rostochiensis TaxID=31243 RepID=A0A914I109_GLORO
MNVLLLLMLFCLFTSHLISANAKAHNKKRNQIVVAKQETNATVDDVVVDIRSNHKAHNDGVAHGNSLKRTDDKNIEDKIKMN